MTERNRNYEKEYRDFQGTPLQKKRRAQRNAARRLMARKGRVHKGDGLDVDHRSRNEKGMLSNALSNLRVQVKSRNRARNGK